MFLIFFKFVLSLGIYGCHNWNIFLFNNKIFKPKDLSLITQGTTYFSLENHLFLITLNAVVYTALLTFFFCVFFLFDFRIFRTLSEYKFFRTTGFINTTLIILFLSMAGIPPLMGFLAKVFLFYLLFLTKYYIIIIFIIIFNLFVMYFYIQNIRFIYSKSAPNIYLYYKYKVNFNFPLIVVLSFGLFFNLGGIFFFEYIITLLHQMTLFIKIF